MRIHVEFVLNNEDPGNLWGDKGGPGQSSGGTPWDPPKGRLEHGAGGECFAPRLRDLQGCKEFQGFIDDHGSPGEMSMTHDF